MAMERVRRRPSDGWSSKFSMENTKISHRLPILLEKPNISYSALKQLCSIEGLGNRRKDSTKAAHDSFMKNYSSIFHPAQEKLPALDLKPHNSTTAGKLNNSSTQSIQTGSHEDIQIPHGHGKPHYCTKHDNPMSHNIRDHLALLHKQHITQTKEGLLNARIQSLRKLLKKLPFERKRSDQEAIFNHLQNFTELTNQIPLELLKELSSLVQIEKWNEAGCTVICNNKLYLILRGSVTPLNEDYFATSTFLPGEHPSSDKEESESETQKLSAGHCFGTINEDVEGAKCHSDNESRISSVVTLGPCEFLKISAREFGKMKQLVDGKETNLKLQLVQSCRLFENWPKVALGKIVELIGWKVFHPGQVLVNEGESCQVIGFIGEGVCLLKRSINVAKIDRDGAKRRRQKQVIVGRIGPGDSFGECTVLRDQPIPYSVVTSTCVQLGIISEQDFREVDDVTKCLLSQSYEAIDNMSEEELQKQYIEQQKQNEWIKFKRNILHDVILYRSILPGYGKWSRNPTMEDVINLA